MSHKRERQKTKTPSMTDRVNVGLQALQGLPTLSAAQLIEWPRREKPLPPDANAHGSTHTLYQLDSHVRFNCSRCGRMGVTADILACDFRANTLQCAKCYERLIRPRQFQPLRVHPFPNMVSWVNYTPRAAVEDKSEQIENQSLEKPPEAFYPSGERLNTNVVSLPGAKHVPRIAFHPGSSVLLPSNG